MDAFFAGVEIRSDPRFVDKPLVVGGGPGPRGVVTAASYPARVFGVHAGMSLGEARRLCPDLLFVPVDPAKMVHESLAVLALLDRLCPRVEPASIDEAYLDFGRVPLREWPTRALALGERVRDAVRDERGLSASVGLAPNKLQAKMASPRNKPGGVTVVPPGTFALRFGGSPVGEIPGVGPKTVEALATLGIRTVADLAAADEHTLRGRFGIHGADLVGTGRGDDPRRVLTRDEEPDAKSAGHETTFGHDVADARFLRATLWLLADRVGRRLRRADARAATVCVTYRIERKRFTRQRRLTEPTDQAVVLARVGWDLLERERRGRALRLLGISGADLVRGGGSGDLLVEDRRRRTVVATGDRLRDRFGENALVPAGSLLDARRTRRAGGASLGWNPLRRGKA